MALRPCPECRKEISTSAATCPNCGAPTTSRPAAVPPAKTRPVFKILGGILLALFLLPIASKTCGETPAPKATVVVSNEQPSAVSAGPVMPSDEAAFCTAVDNFVAQYEHAESAGENELKRSRLRTARKAAMLEALGNARAVKSWIGELTGLSTNSDGNAAVEIKLPCKATVKTWNNSLSDISDDTLIPGSSPLYNALADLKKHDAVVFGGRFVRSQEDGVREASVSERGSMTDPEFIFKFSAVSQ